MIKSIYHSPVSSFSLCKKLGFTHVNIPLWTFANLDASLSAMTSAHELDLHCIVSQSDPTKNDLKEVFSKDICKQCIAYLVDEPNLHGIKPDNVMSLKEWFKERGYQTMIVLSDIRGYFGYENCADWIGFDYYKDLTISRKLKLWARIKVFQIRNKSKIFAVPAVKPGKIVSQWSFWKDWIGVENFYWYQFYPTQERPPWSDKNLTDDEDLQRSFFLLNNCEK